ncbi:MAG: hypothetical protein JSR85_00460 [Proteobacteria bacterium]|nr:hypothetical protein [Pseudomonadota bacterium]
MKKIIFTLLALISICGVENVSASTSNYVVWYGPITAGGAAGSTAQRYTIAMPDGIGFDSGQVELERALADVLNNQQFTIRDNIIFANKRKIELNKKNWAEIMAALKAGTLTVTPKVVQ